MKKLLIVSAWLEGVTGVALMVSPAPPVLLLVGAALDTTGGLIIARVAGAALLSLGLACWLARDDGRSGRRVGSEERHAPAAIAQREAEDDEPEIVSFA